MASSSATRLLGARSAQSLGRMRIGNPPGTTAVAWVAVRLVALLVAFAAWGEVTRKVRVAGHLVPEAGTLQLSAPVAGAVAVHRVAEGDSKQAGKALFALATDRPSPQGALSNLAYSSLQHRRAALEAEVAARRLQSDQLQEAMRSHLRAQGNDRRQAETEAAFVERWRTRLLHHGPLRPDGSGRVRGRRSGASHARRTDGVAGTPRGGQPQRRGRYARFAGSPGGAERSSCAMAGRPGATGPEPGHAGAGVDRKPGPQDAGGFSPQAGSITGLHLPLGAGVQPGQTLATLVPGSTSR